MSSDIFVLPRPLLTHRTLGVLEILYLVSALTSRGAWREACGPLEMRLLTMNGGYWVRSKYGFSVIPRFWLLFLSLRFPGRKTVAELCWRFCKVAATPLNVLPCFFRAFEDSVFLQEAGGDSKQWILCLQFCKKYIRYYRDYTNEREDACGLCLFKVARNITSCSPTF